MGSSQHTPNIYLPVFTDTDKPTWLGDFNDAMNKIDMAINNHVQDLILLQNRVTADEATITTIQGKQTTDEGNITTLQGDITTINGEISTIQSKQTTDETNIASNTSAIAGIDTTISIIQSKQTTDEGNISTLQSNLATVTSKQNVDEGTLSTHTAEIASIQNVVNQITWQILFAGTDSDTTNSSGEIGVYHAFGKTPASIHIEVQGPGANLFHSIHGSDASHFIVRFENSDGTPYVGAVTFFYTVIG